MFHNESNDHKNKTTFFSSSTEKKADDFFNRAALSVKEVEEVIISSTQQMREELPLFRILGRDLKTLKDDDINIFAKSFEVTTEEAKKEILTYSQAPQGQLRFNNDIGVTINEKFPLFDNESYCQSLTLIEKIMLFLQETEIKENDQQKLYDALAQLFIQFAKKAIPYMPASNGSADIDHHDAIATDFKNKFFSLFRNKVNVNFILYGRNSCLLDCMHQLNDLEALVKKGVNFNTRCFADNTPLLTAIALAINRKAMHLLNLSERYSARYDDIHFPKAYRMNLDLQDNIRGNTALHLTIAKGHKKGHEGDTEAPSNFELVEKLIALKANVNIQDKNGNTPLHLACARREKAVIQLLLDAGADTTIGNEMKQSPLDMLALSFTQANRLMRTQTTTGDDDMNCHTLKDDDFSSADVNELKEMLTRPSLSLTLK